MADFANISLPFDTTILSTITSAIATNFSGDGIVAIANGETTAMSSTVSASMPVWIGFIGCLVASIFFGSNLVPVKQFSAGDGLFFQFVFCATVYVVGLIVDLIIGNQRFYPLVLIGGDQNIFLITLLSSNICLHS